MFADPIDHAVLQDPEQIGLQVERHLPDLVQTEHPATRLLDFAGASMLVRAGEGVLWFHQSRPSSHALSTVQITRRYWIVSSSTSISLIDMSPAMTTPLSRMRSSRSARLVLCECWADINGFLEKGGGQAAA